MTIRVTVPPGISFVCLHLPRALLPAILVYSLAVLLRRGFGVQLATWLVLAMCILSLPLAFSLSVAWKDFKNKRRAHALDATFPPRIVGKLPGSIDLLWEVAQMKHIIYPGDILGTWLNENNNTIDYRVLFEDRIFTSEPEYIKNILATNFDNFEKGETFYGIMEPLLGSGVFNSDGERWKFHRSITRPFFTKDKIRHFQIFNRHAENAISQMKDRFRQGHAVDIQDVVSRFTLDSATEFLFGGDVRSLSAGLNYPPGEFPTDSSTEDPSNLFAGAFSTAQEIVARRTTYSFAWPVTEFWQDEIKKRMDIIRAFIDPIVESVLKKERNGKGFQGRLTDDDEDGTLLEHLVKLTDDPTIIKDETLNIMIAGRDTTASVLTFVLGILAQHPEMFARLRKEVIERLGSTRMPTYDDLRNMKYLRAVINETLRLYPPVPFNLRFSINETVWPPVNGGKPLYIPERSMCVYSVFLMHRRKDLWGPDALEFDPDRFLDERVGKYLTPNPFIFLPFNAGPRICLGQQFAYNETSLMIIRLLQSFSEISLAPEVNLASKPPPAWATGEGRKPHEKIWLKVHLTMYANNGCWVRMKEAGDAEVI